MDEIMQDEEYEVIFKECDLDSKYRKPKPLIPFPQRVMSQFRCSGTRFSKFMKRKMPILEWLPKYNLRKNISGDVAAGLTVGVVHIPQGLAYSQLASLPPVVGLYVSLFPVLLYPIFGTSRQVSMGTFAIVSIIVSGVLTQQVSPDYCGDTVPSTASYQTDTTYTDTSYMPTLTPANISGAAIDCTQIYNDRMIEVAAALALTVGLVQIVMHVFGLGTLSAFLSESMLSGFLCGASFLVIASQIPALLGLPIKRPDPPFTVIKIFIAIFENIRNTNIATLLLSAIAIAFLMLGKHVNERFKKRLRIPIPWELFLVAISTLLSYFLKLNEVYQVANVGVIPKGSTSVAFRRISTSVPKPDDIIAVFVDAIPVAAAAFTIEITQCQMWSIKHSYDTDSNQELLALGICNIFGSFFCCYPSGPSLSRSAIYDEVGAKTQLGSYVSSAVVLIVLLWMGPLFQPLPQAVLAAIIIVNIRLIALLFKNVPSLWRISRLDAMTWIVTWLGVLMLNVTMGLVIGAVFSIVTFLIRIRNLEGMSLGKVSSGVYRNAAKYSTVTTNDDIFIYQFTGPVFFGNKDRFIDDLVAHLGYNPVQLASREPKDRRSDASSMGASSPDPETSTANSTPSDLCLPEAHATSEKTSDEDHIVLETNRFSVVIFDMSRCSFADSDGAKCIRNMCESLQSIGKTVMMASCSDDVKVRLKSCWVNAAEVNYISLESAVKVARNTMRKSTRRH